MDGPMAPMKTAFGWAPRVRMRAVRLRITGPLSLGLRRFNNRVRVRAARGRGWRGDWGWDWGWGWS